MYLRSTVQVSAIDGFHITTWKLLVVMSLFSVIKPRIFMTANMRAKRMLAALESTTIIALIVAGHSICLHFIRSKKEADLPTITETECLQRKNFWRYINVYNITGTVSKLIGCQSTREIIAHCVGVHFYHAINNKPRRR